MIGLKNGTFRQCLATFIVSISMAMSGMLFSWSTPTLPSLLSNSTETKLIESVWTTTSLPIIGSVFGAIIAGFLLDIIGRKFTLLLSALPALLSWVIILNTESTDLLNTARVISGIVAGKIIGSSSLYVAEISHPNIRGRLNYMNIIMLEIGYVIVVLLKFHISYKTLTGILAAVPLIFFGSFYWMPESPYHFLRQGNKERAWNSYKYFRFGFSNIEAELHELYNFVRKEMENPNGLIKMLSSDVYRKNFFIIIGLETLHVFCGSYVLAAYSENIFNSTSMLLSPKASIIICSLLPIPLMFLSSIVVDRLGRKPLYYISIIGTIIGYVAEFIFYTLQDVLHYNMKDLSWLALLGIIMIYVFKNIGLTSLPYVYLSELFPSNIRSRATSLVLFYTNLLAFGFVLVFPLIVSKIGCYVYVIFIVSLAIGLVFVYFFVPETKNKHIGTI